MNLYLYISIIVFFILSNIYFYNKNKKIFIEIAKDIRITRTIHFLLMILFGIIVAGKISPLTITIQKIFEILFLNISVFYAVLYSTISNNFADVKIDLISNPDRPLPKKSVDPVQYNKAGTIILYLSLFYSIIINFKTFAIVASFIAIYYIYSMPPFRFKRAVVISKLCISINSMLLSFGGFFLFNNDLSLYPVYFIYFFVFILTFTINFIDLKDYHGDMEGNIKTLPVLLGLKNAKILCGIFFIFTYMIAAFIFFPLLFAGIWQYFLVTKKKYNEHNVFLLYLSSIIILFIFLFFKWNIKIIL